MERMMTRTYQVEGMGCDGCRDSVETVLARHVTSVKVTLEPPEAVLSGGRADDLDALNAALAKGGYALKPFTSQADLR
jgi:copper chaperone CopZ